MNILFDTSTYDNHFGTSQTLSITVAANDNRVLVVGVHLEGGGRPTGVTYAGQPMIEIASAAPGGSNESSLWYILAPATGANDVVASYDGSTYTILGAISLYNVAQEAPEAFAVANGSGTDVGVTVTGCSTDSWVVDAAQCTASAYSLTEDAGQTERYEDSRGSRGAGSTKPDVAAGNIDMGWTISSSGAWAIVAASFKKYTAGGAPYPVSELRKGLLSGYHVFMDQYVKAKDQGLDPLKLPDGTPF